MRKPKSTTLFHFTRTLEVVKSILKTGFTPRYSLEDISWLGFDSNQRVAYPMTCFCDIPLSRITEHVEFYGQYGIGMTRDWALTQRLNPLAYMVENSLFADTLGTNFRTATQAISQKQDQSQLLNIRNAISFTKPLVGTMIVNNAPIPKEFYQESEWRYIASHESVPDYINHLTFKDTDKLSAHNAKAKEHATLEFSPRDVKYIFVKSDSDIPDLVNFINTELDQFPAADLKVLTTRILSLSTIEEDI